MIEYRDGNFGAMAPAKDVIDLLNKIDLQEVKAVHFGTASELSAVRENKIHGLDEVKDRLTEIERQLKPGSIKIFQIDDLEKMAVEGK